VESKETHNQNLKFVARFLYPMSGKNKGAPKAVKKALFLSILMF